MSGTHKASEATRRKKLGRLEGEYRARVEGYIAVVDIADSVRRLQKEAETRSASYTINKKR